MCFVKQNSRVYHADYSLRMLKQYDNQIQSTTHTYASTSFETTSLGKTRVDRSLADQPIQLTFRFFFQLIQFQLIFKQRFSFSL